MIEAARAFPPLDYATLVPAPPDERYLRIGHRAGQITVLAESDRPQRRATVCLGPGWALYYCTIPLMTLSTWVMHTTVLSPFNYSIPSVGR